MSAYICYPSHIGLLAASYCEGNQVRHARTSSAARPAALRTSSRSRTSNR